MKMYENMPRELVNGWPSPKEVHHRPGSGPFDFHYHDVEEWLEVLEGTIAFYTAGERAYALVADGALNIQPGEVHRVEIGPGGVKYRMWLPVGMSDETFQHKLDAQDIVLVRRNLDLPGAENRWDDVRMRGTPVAGNTDLELLDNFTSAGLMFRNAKGKFLVKDAYLWRNPATVKRIPSDTICILYKDADHLFLSTVVQTESKQTGARESFTNTRFFVREEDGSWRCRVWMNFPEPVVS